MQQVYSGTELSAKVEELQTWVSQEAVKKNQLTQPDLLDLDRLGDDFGGSKVGK